jgi:aminoglycoside-2''-adenylyltransferase
MATHIPPAIAKIAPDGNLTPRQKRRFMIDMVKRNGKPGTGSGHEFMRRRTAMNPWPDLRPILKGIEWAIVGGVATRAYMPERMTKDMDILVHQNDKDTVLARLQQAGYQMIEQLAIPGYSLRSPEGIEVDVLFSDDTWLQDALRQPVLDPAGYPVISLPYLILLKMGAQRTQDWADVSRMLGLATDTELDAVRAVVARYTPDDSEDLESLIFIGKQEHNP